MGESKRISKKTVALTIYDFEKRYLVFALSSSSSSYSISHRLTIIAGAWSC